MYIYICKDSKKFKPGRRARLGNSISPKLFTSCLQYASINKISWESKDIRIDGEYLSNLISADDIALIANSISKLQEMLQDIHSFSEPVGIRMYLGKTKLMHNKHVNKDDVIADRKKNRGSLKLIYINA